jgi:hypothetical protein
MNIIIDIISWLAAIVMVVLGANALISTLVLTLGRPAVTIAEGGEEQ